MIAVTVRYHNILRRAAGIVDELVTLPEDAALRDLLEHLAQSHGPALREMLFAPDGAVSSHLVIFRRRKLVRREQLGEPLDDGEELMLFPAIAGG